MFRPKPIFRFIYITFMLLLLLSFSTPILSSTDSDSEEDIEELIALDEEQETHGGVVGHHVSEAEVLSKAQRVVLELNIDSTERVLRENEYVLVLGYAPWCARSAELMPQFAEAAMALKELGSPLLMAKIDAERYPKAASILGIKGFPTLLLFVNGSSQLYTGGFTGEDIAIWAIKKTGVPVVRVSSVTEAEEVVKKYSAFVIGRFEKFEGPGYEEFIKAAASDNEIQFVEVSDVEVAKVLFPDVKPISPFLGLVKSEAEKYTTFEGSFTEDKMLEFLNYNKFPLVNILTERNSARIYSSPIKLQVFVFAKADEFEKLLEPLQNVAQKFLSQVLFVLVDIAEENLSKPFLTLFGLEDTKKTVVSAFDNNVSSKYLLESEPTPSHLEEFSRRLLLGTQPPYFKSQPVPDNTEAMIQIVVGKTFDDLVLNNPKNVLLEVHAPWCINCEATSKHVEKLAKHFKGLDTLVFARLDASANEHPKLKVDDYPTLLFYPVGDKLNPIKLSTRTGVKELAASINKNLKAKAEATKDEL